MAVDHKELLRKFVDYIIDRNGWAWIEGDHPASKRFNAEEWAELHLMQKESKDKADY